MSTLTAPLRLVPAHPADDVRDLTLGRLLDGAWQDLQARSSADCPLCGDLLDLAGDAGRCRDCGSELR